MEANKETVLKIMDAGIKPMADSIMELDRITIVDILMVGHNLHRFMVESALRSLEREEGLTGDQLKEAYSRLWISAVTTMLDDSIGVDYFVNTVISTRTDEYVEELLSSE